MVTRRLVDLAVNGGLGRGRLAGAVRAARVSTQQAHHEPYRRLAAAAICEIGRNIGSGSGLSPSMPPTTANAVKPSLW
jgi:hypothetical protein